MKRTQWKQMLGLLGALALVPAAAAVAQNGGTVVRGELTSEVLQPAHPGITSEFHNLVREVRSSSPARRTEMMGSGHDTRFAPLFRTRGEANDLIEAYIWLERWDEPVKAAIEKMGVEIAGEDEASFTLHAWVPLDLVETVAEIDGVRQLRRPSYGIPSAGSVITEGDSNLNTNFIRSVGQLDGSGVRVGVISVGLFNQLFPSGTASNQGSNRDQRVQTGNIPAHPESSDGPTSRFFGAVEISPASFEFHDIRLLPDNLVRNVGPIPNFPEGAATLETIHDLAPGAQLYYADGLTTVDVQRARQFLLSRGVDVIVDTMVFYDAGRFDGTSTVSRGAQELALRNNVVYVSSVGNHNPPLGVQPGEGRGAQSGRFPLYVNSHFTSRITASGAKFHNFAANTNPLLVNETLPIFPLNGVIDAVLVWDDIWDDQNPRATDDLDLYLFDSNFPEISQAVSISNDLQNGQGRPVERITFFAPFNQQYSLGINRKNREDNSRTLFTLIILQGIVPENGIQYLTHGVPLNNADALAPVITVGAVDATKGVNRIDEFTIPGLTPGPGRAVNNDFVVWYEGQRAPAVVSYANTAALSASFFDSGGVFRQGVFPGSSAGAAHIGGLITLLRHDQPGLPAFRFYDILRETTPGPVSPVPNATRLQTSELSEYKNAPVYLRPNGYDIWTNIRDSVALGKFTRQAIVSTGRFATEWEHSDERTGLTPPLFDRSDQGLTISPGGKKDVFGFWQTPVLTFTGLEGEPTKELRTDRIYAIRARIGSDESDPTRVPTFRIRAITGGSDEAAVLWIAGVHSQAANPPTTIGGKDYTLYYSPSNPELAKQGLRVSFDLVHYDANKNDNATLYLHDLTVEELELPK